VTGKEEAMILIPFVIEKILQFVKRTESKEHQKGLNSNAHRPRLHCLHRPAGTGLEDGEITDFLE